MYTKSLANLLLNKSFDNVRYNSDSVVFLVNGKRCKVFAHVVSGGTGICVYFEDDSLIDKTKNDIYRYAFKIASKEFLVSSAPHDLKISDFVNSSQKSDLKLVQKEQEQSKQDVAAFAKTMGNTTFETHSTRNGNISLANTAALYHIAHVLSVITNVILVIGIIALVIASIVLSIVTKTPAFLLLMLIIIPIGIAIAIVSFFSGLFAGASDETQTLERKINNLSNR